jgi:hypothetical protein
VATRHVRPPGAMLARSDAMHAVELARLLGRQSLKARNRYLGVREYERSPVRADARNGFYARDVVTRLGPGGETTPPSRRTPSPSIRPVRGPTQRATPSSSRVDGGRPTRGCSGIRPNCSRSSTVRGPFWGTLRTTNVIERCCVEVRRRTRPMVCVVNVQSVERIICSIVNRFNLGWRLRTLRQCTHVA